MLLKPISLCPCHSFLLAHWLITCSISSVENPVVMAADRTNRRYLSGSVIRNIFIPMRISSGVPAFGVLLISAQAELSAAINGFDSLTLGPSTFRISRLGMVVSSLSLLCGFASALFDVLRFKFAVSDSFIFISTARRDEFTPPADCWWLNADRSGRSAHVVFVIGNHICLFQFWDKQNNALFVSFPNSNSKHFILQMQLGLPNSLFLGFCL